MGDPLLLLVDENPDDVYLALRELRRLGRRADVYTISDSAQALSYLREAEELPSALLLGLKFVHLSGLELLTELRSSERTRHLPVVILTAGPEELERVGREVAHAKPVACITKPLEITALRSALGDLGVGGTPVPAH
ncbi:MAG: response regulator [Trueperaceae bacterium]